jgi:hypothetical protein
MMLTFSMDASFVATRHRNLGTSDAVGVFTPSITKEQILGFAPGTGRPKEIRAHGGQQSSADKQFCLNG